MNYFKTYQKKDCNGCGVCSLRCPKKAIAMVEDEEGFLYPVIDKSKCINCGLCEKVCSNNPKNSKITEAYIAINNDKKVLSESSSGGMYSILAEYVINLNGVVYGVTYNEKNEVVHAHIEKKEDIKKFRYSKYVRSNLKSSYKEIEQYLKEDKYVLFTGTPCQCSGLRSYLIKDYDKLITCEIICHGNASPKVFKMFLNNIETKYNKKIESIYFRYKKYGWHGGNTYAVLEDGKEIEIPEFTNAFLNDLISRPSCHDCRFCTTERFSDFTIGDFWGIDKIEPSVIDDNTGVSLLCVNTDKGKSIFDEIKEKMFVKKVNVSAAFSNNHNSNIPYHKKRNDFFEKIENNLIDDSNITYYLKKYTKKPLYRRVLGKIKRIIKKILGK